MEQDRRRLGEITAGRVEEAIGNTKKRVADWLNAPTAAPTDPGELIAQQVKQPTMPGLIDANRARSESSSATGADWVSPESEAAATTSTETDIQRKRKAADKLSRIGL